MSLRSDDGPTFDAAAEQVPSVADALIATIDPARRHALEVWLENTGVSDPRTIPPWLLREGEEAGWILAARCRRELAALPRYGGRWHSIIERLRAVAHAFRRRPVGIWLWAEAFGAIPNYKRVAADHVRAFRHVFEHSHDVPIRALLRAKIPFRSILFDELYRDGKLSLDDALTGLADPSLRATSVAMLRTRVRDVEHALRETLPSASKGTREVIVRLLREIEPRLGGDGKVGPVNLADLEATLRANPRDADASRVWADLLMDRGDPRGQVASFMHGIVAAQREGVLALSEQLAAFTAQHRKGIIGKPGGFPFREKYLGRSLIRFRSSPRAMMRGKPATIVARVHAFLDRVTDLSRPDDSSATRLSYVFALTWPGTKVRLPFQEAGHYPTGALSSTISVVLASGALELSLVFPFDDAQDPDMRPVYAAIAETLGAYVLTSSGFEYLTPTADGKGMKRKLIDYR